MRIEMDYLRDILKVVIDDETGNLSSFNISGEGVSYETSAFHIKILIDEGCLTALDGSTKDGPAYYNIRQTFKGQQFYDAIADDGTWDKIKHYAMEHGIDFTVQAILTVASRFIIG